VLIALLIYRPDHQLRWQSLCASTLPCSSNVLPIGLLLIALIIDRPAQAALLLDCPALITDRRSTCSAAAAHRPAHRPD